MLISKIDAAPWSQNIQSNLLGIHFESNKLWLWCNSYLLHPIERKKRTGFRQKFVCSNITPNRKPIQNCPFKLNISVTVFDVASIPKRVVQQPDLQISRRIVSQRASERTWPQQQLWQQTSSDRWMFRERGKKKPVDLSDWSVWNRLKWTVAQRMNPLTIRQCLYAIFAIWAVMSIHKINPKPTSGELEYFGDNFDVGLGFLFFSQISPKDTPGRNFPKIKKLWLTLFTFAYRYLIGFERQSCFACPGFNWSPGSSLDTMKSPHLCSALCWLKVNT